MAGEAIALAAKFRRRLSEEIYGGLRQKFAIGDGAERGRNNPPIFSHVRDVKIALLS